MEKPSPSEAHRFRPSALVPAFLVFFMQASALLSESLQVRDHEELYNATEGMELLHGHIAQIFLMQYRPFCGGCSVVSALGAGLYAFLPPVLFVFKLVPILFYVGGFLLAFRLVHATAGRTAACLATLCWLLPPPAYARIAQVAFGNHYESNLYALIALTIAIPLMRDAERLSGRGIAWRSFMLGLVLGFALYTCFSAAYLIPALGIALLLRYRVLSWRLFFVLPGLLAGMSPWIAYFRSTGINPVLSPIYRENDWEIGLRYIPHKLKTLVAPNQLEGILAQPHLGGSRILGVLGAIAFAACVVVLVGCALERRRGAARPPNASSAHHGTPCPPWSSDAWLLERSVLLMMSTFLGAYLTLHYFQIDFVADGSAPPSALGLRYLAPLYLHFSLLVPLGAARLIEGGRLGRIAGIAIMGIVLFNGLTGRMATMAEAPWSTAFLSQMGADYPYFQVQAVTQLPPAVHEKCRTLNPASERFHIWSQGWLEASAAWADDPGVRLDPADARAARRRRLSRLRAPPGSNAEAWYAGVARVYHDHLVRGDVGIRHVLQGFAYWTGGLPDEAFQALAREFIRIPPWFEDRINRNPRLGRVLEEDILALEEAGGEHDLLHAAVWGAGYVLGGQYLIASAHPPRTLGAMGMLVARRLVGRGWETSNVEERPLLRIPRELPAPLVPDWLEGYGEALGERWGPRLRPITAPEGTPAGLVPLFVDAYRRGEGRWFVATDE